MAEQKRIGIESGRRRRNALYGRGIDDSRIPRRINRFNGWGTGQCPPLYTNAAIIRWSGVERTSLFGASSTSDSIDRAFSHCHRVTVHRTERTEDNMNGSLIPRIQHRIQHGSHALSKSKYTNYEIFIRLFIS